jgi:hypothetical protein
LQIERDGAGRHLPGAIGGRGGGLFGHDEAFRNGGGPDRLIAPGGSTRAAGRQTKAVFPPYSTVGPIVVCDIPTVRFRKTARQEPLRHASKARFGPLTQTDLTPL